MSEPSPDEFSARSSDEEITSGQPSLGVKNPLISPSPLGQNFLSPKFISPIGSQSLIGINREDYNLVENDLPDSSSLAEPPLSRSNPEATIPRSITNSDRFILQSSPQENEPEPPISAAAPRENEQTEAFDTTLVKSTVVQPQLATPQSEAPKQIESSVADSEPIVPQITELTEEPEAIANINPTTPNEPEAIANINPTTPNKPANSTPLVSSLQLQITDNLFKKPVVSPQPELAPVEQIAPTTDNNDFFAPPQSNKTSLPPTVESLPQTDKLFTEAPQSPQSVVQAKAAITPTPQIPATDTVSLQRFGQEDTEVRHSLISSDHLSAPTPDRELVAQANLPTNDDAKGEQNSDIASSNPTVVQSFSDTSAPNESPIRQQVDDSLLNKVTTNSSTPLAKSELETTPISYSTLPQPIQERQSPRVSRDALDIVQPLLETKSSNSNSTAFPESLDFVAPQESTDIPQAPTREIPQSAFEPTSVAKPDFSIAQPSLESPVSAPTQVTSSQDQESTTQLQLKQTANEPIVTAPPSKQTSGATKTTPSDLVVQAFTEPQSPNYPPTEIREIPETKQTSETTPSDLVVQAFTEPQSPNYPPTTSKTTPSDLVVQPFTEPQSPNYPPTENRDIPETKQTSETTPSDLVVQPFTEPQSPNYPPTENREIPESKQTSETTDSDLVVQAFTEPQSPNYPPTENRDIPNTKQTLGATKTTDSDLVVQPFTEPQSPNYPPTENREIPETKLPSEISPTIQIGEELQQETSTAGELGKVPQGENFSSVLPQPSTISTNLLQPAMEDEVPESVAQLPSAVEKTSVSELEITTPVVESSNQQHLEVTQPNEIPVAAKLDAASVTNSQQLDKKIAPQSVTQESVETVVQPLVETAPSVDKQTLFPEIDETSSSSGLTEPSLEPPATVESITNSEPVGETALQSTKPPQSPDLATTAMADDQVKAIAFPNQTASAPPENSLMQSQSLPEMIQQAAAEPAPSSAIDSPSIVQPRLVDDTKRRSEISTTSNETELVEDNSPQVSPTISNNLLQRKTSATESLNQNPDIPQLPTVLGNLIESRYSLPLIQPLNQPSEFLGAASRVEPLKEQQTMLQRRLETSATTSNPETFAQPAMLQRRQEASQNHPTQEILNQASEQTVKVQPVSFNPEPLTIQLATDITRKQTSEPNSERRTESSPSSENVPDSWSSIAELIGESTDDFSSVFDSATPLQRAFDDSSDWQQPQAWETIIPQQSGYSNLASSFSQQNSIQRFTTEQTPDQEDISSTEKPSKHEDSENAESQNLELLAWEIYGLVRQRLEIERERYGNYYSNRLPW